ncbi:MAG: histidine kinase [Muribaculaceae bacterium]|nr:histidine kinase [Muribaculaceae bacterium]
MTDRIKFINYLVVIICAILLSSGPVCMVYLITEKPLGFLPLWLIIPLSAITLGGIMITDKILVARFLEKDRYLPFFLWVFLLSFVIEYSAILIEYAFRHFNGIIQRTNHPFSPPVWLFSLIAGAMLVILLAGVSLWKLYSKRCRQEQCEKEYSSMLREQTDAFRRRINMPAIKSRLAEIIPMVRVNPENANLLIRQLSDYLRSRLYETRTMLKEFPLRNIPEATVLPDSSVVAAFISSRSYRLRRHIALLALYAFISLGLLFDYPDVISLDSVNVIWAISFFIFLAVFTYLNVYVLFPLFFRKKRQRLYACLLLAVPLVIIIVFSLISISENGDYNPYGIKVPTFVIPLGIAGTMLSFLYIMAGTATLSMIKDYILGKWRLSRLQAETRRIEFETLQNQVNPHFLFNVLNNAGILSYDDPEESVRTLRGMEYFLEYMLDDVSRTETSVGKEIEFLSNYLIMEKSSGKNLEVSIDCPHNLYPLRIPTLLLIPLVENAVKHSADVAGICFISISFSEEDGSLFFNCSNSSLPPSYNPGLPKDESDERVGGIGLYNIRRRLKLLFGPEASLKTEFNSTIFTAKLKIPLNFS